MEGSVVGVTIDCMDNPARHKAGAHITPTDKAMIWQVTFPKGPPTTELALHGEYRTHRLVFKSRDRLIL